MSNDEAMLFGLMVMLGSAFIIFYLIGKDNDK
jgi:ABC-type cobalt transport system substrate-binding protein